jgi:general secretion pathway protein D
MPRFFKFFAIIGFCSLTACGTFYDRNNSSNEDVYSAIKKVDLTAKKSTAMGGEGVQLNSIKPHAETYFNTAEENNDPSRAGAAKSDVQSGYDIDFQATPIEVAARSILGDILKVNYEIDSRVQGTVTLASGRPLQNAELLAAFEAALQSAGGALLHDHTAYRIVPLSEAPGASGFSASSTPEPGYGVTVLPLKHIAAETIQKIMEGFAAKPGTVRAVPARNLLLIQGSSIDRQTALDSALTFDQDWMKGQSVGIYPVASAAPDAIIVELQRIMDSGEGGAAPGLIQFQPIARMNSILVIAHRPELLKTAATWIARLDRADNAANSTRVYRVKYGDAKQIAGVLNDAFASGGGSGAPASEDASLSANGPSNAASSHLQNSANGGGSTDQSAVMPGNPNSGVFSNNTVLAAGSFAGSDATRTSGASSGSSNVRTENKRIRITPDPMTNSLLIFADQETSTMILRVIERLDRPRLQVAIEATIAEVSLNNSLQYGVQYFLKGNGINGSSSDGGSIGLNGGTSQPIGKVLPGFNFLLGSETDPSAILSALSGRTNVKVLSNPSLVVLDNQVASLQVGDQVPVATSQATLVGTPATGNSAFPVANNIDYRNTGVILRVLPRVSANGNVTLEIEQEISNVVDNISKTSLTPSVSQRKVKSSVAVASGQTVLLAGLISDRQQGTRNGVPILEKITLLGDLFAQNQTAANRTELIIFIKPQIIQEAIDAQAIAMQMRDKMINAGKVK